MQLTCEVFFGGKWQPCLAWFAVPVSTGTAMMMKLPASLDDELVHALLILFAAKIEI